jgi:protein-tyrosine phosphatase
MINKVFYNLICLARNKKSLDIVNKFAYIDDYNEIIPNLYLGNINCANNQQFLIDNNIQSIINCTMNEPFNEYFSDKNKLRLTITDSKESDNMDNFKKQIFEAIYFIEDSLNNDKSVYIHCYWGLMRSATVVAAYLMKKYNMPKDDAISIIREKRCCALLPFYNFNEVLNYVEENMCK